MSGSFDFECRVGFDGGDDGLDGDAPVGDELPPEPDGRPTRTAPPTGSRRRGRRRRCPVPWPRRGARRLPRRGVRRARLRVARGGRGRRRRRAPSLRREPSSSLTRMSMSMTRMVPASTSLRSSSTISPVKLLRDLRGTRRSRSRSAQFVEWCSVICSVPVAARARPAGPRRDRLGWWPRLLRAWVYGVPSAIFFCASARAPLSAFDVVPFRLADHLLDRAGHGGLDRVGVVVRVGDDQAGATDRDRLAGLLLDACCRSSCAAPRRRRHRSRRRSRSPRAAAGRTDRPRTRRRARPAAPSSTMWSVCSTERLPSRSLLTTTAPHEAGAAVQDGLVVLVGGLRRQVAADQDVGGLVVDVHRRAPRVLSRTGRGPPGRAGPRRGGPARPGPTGAA